MTDEKEIDDVLDSAEEDTESPSFQLANEEDIIPAFGSLTWQDYVLRQLRDSELSDGSYPRCAGLRRIIGDLLGPIVESEITQYTPPSRENNGTATVCVRISIVVTNETHPAYELSVRKISVEDIADVNKFNMNEPYCNHPSASAATRAESRALKRLLMLDVHTAEEMDSENIEEDPEWSPDEPITESQINVIDLICRRNDINVTTFINSGKRYYDNIREVTKTTASHMIGQLNHFQRKEKPIPENLVGYKENWRKNNESTN
jgi:hypothetical protein